MDNVLGLVLLVEVQVVEGADAMLLSGVRRPGGGVERHAIGVHREVAVVDAWAAGRGRAGRPVKRADQVVRIRVRKGGEARCLSSGATGHDPRVACFSEEAAPAA